jgi:hypothetical protein
MSKQSNATNQTGIKPAASGGSGASPKQSETKKISNGGSVFGAKVGPKSAPYHEK